jgi:hypothetical protein
LVRRKIEEINFELQRFFKNQDKEFLGTIKVYLTGLERDVCGTVSAAAVWAFSE